MLRGNVELTMKCMNSANQYLELPGALLEVKEFSTLFVKSIAHSWELVSC